MVEEEGEDERASKKRKTTARGGRRGRGDAVLEEMDDVGALLGPREEGGEEGDGEVVPEGERGIRRWGRP